MIILRWCALALGYLVTVCVGYLLLIWIDHVLANHYRRRKEASDE